MVSRLLRNWEAVQAMLDQQNNHIFVMINNVEQSYFWCANLQHCDWWVCFIYFILPEAEEKQKVQCSILVLLRKVFLLFFDVLTYSTWYGPKVLFYFYFLIIWGLT